MDYPEFPRLPISSILKKWLTVLSTDADITAYCMSKYGKAPTVSVGVDIMNRPQEEDCPIIVLWPGNKVEGISQPTYSYSPAISWVVVQENVTKTANTAVFDGIYEVDELGELILKSIMFANPDYPITQVEYNSDLMEHQPQYMGHMDITIQVDITLCSDQLDY